MKTLLYRYAFIAILIYLISAFVAWNINPASWDVGTRFGCAFIFLVIGSIVTIVTGLED